MHSLNLHNLPRLAIASLGMAGLAVILACNGFGSAEGEPAKDAGAPRTDPATPAKAADATDANRDAERSQFVKDMNARLEAAEKKLESIRPKVEAAGKEIQSDVSEARRDARAKLDALQSGAQDTWQTTREGVQDTWQATRDGLAEAMRRFEERVEAARKEVDKES